MSGRARGQGGFTLIELLVAIVITGIIVAALTEAVIQGFKTTDATSARVARSSAAQALTSAVTEDVHRAETVARTADPEPIGNCVTRDAGRFIRFTWTDTTVAHVAVYALDPTGDAGDHDLVRYECVAGGLPVRRILGHFPDAVGAPSAVTVACKAAITDTSTALCPDPGTPATVVLSIRVDPYPLPASQLTLQRRLSS
ncbi:MAG TPA: type II secretion system protein [Acidimicrobiales bacterium]|nr:type II secretion system protein [Acidimicrobiales bacterium]